MLKLEENFTDEEVENLIRSADLDQDGEINYREFKRMLSDPKRPWSSKRWIFLNIVYILYILMFLQQNDLFRLQPFHVFVFIEYSRVRIY